MDEWERKRERDAVNLTSCLYFISVSTMCICSMQSRAKIQHMILFILMKIILLYALYRTSHMGNSISWARVKRKWRIRSLEHMNAKSMSAPFMALTRHWVSANASATEADDYWCVGYDLYMYLCLLSMLGTLCSSSVRSLVCIVFDNIMQWMYSSSW